MHFIIKAYISKTAKSTSLIVSISEIIAIEGHSLKQEVTLSSAKLEQVLETIVGFHKPTEVQQEL